MSVDNCGDPRLIDPRYMLAEEAGYFSGKSRCQYISDMDKEEYSILKKESKTLDDERSYREMMGFGSGCCLVVLVVAGMGELHESSYVNMAIVAVWLGCVLGGLFCACGSAFTYCCKGLPSATKIEVDRESRLDVKIRKISHRILQLEKTASSNDEIDQLYQARSYFETVTKKFCGPASITIKRHY